MKGIGRKALEDSRPNESAEDAVGFCLRKLYADRQHRILDEVVKGLVFEELIGALLLAQDAVEATQVQCDSD